MNWEERLNAKVEVAFRPPSPHGVWLMLSVLMAGLFFNACFLTLSGNRAIGAILCVASIVMAYCREQALRE